MFPVLFRLPDWLGGIEIPTYGLFMAGGALAGAFLFALLARTRGCDRARAFEAAIEPILVGVVAAKIAGVLKHPPGDGALLVTLLRTGGIWYVGFLAGVAWAAWRFRGLGLRTMEGLDLAAAGVALGHGIGRLGCFMAGCCHGAACEAPWAVTFTSAKAHAMTGVPLGMPLHPTQLYEALGEWILCGVLVLLLLGRRYRFHGQPGLVYVVGYALLRLGVEELRGDPRGTVGGEEALSTSQAIAAAVLVAAVPFLAIGWWRGTLRLRGGPVPGGDARPPAPS